MHVIPLLKVTYFVERLSFSLNNLSRSTLLISYRRTRHEHM